MARRHHLDRGSWESVFRRLEELVLANSGQDEFQELFKLIVAKLYQESCEGDSPLLATEPEVTAANVQLALGKAERRWPGILAGGMESLLSADHLQVCLEIIQGISFLGTSLEVMDALFEHLVSRAAKGAKGQYFTPRHVIEAAVRMVNPRADECIADPACGSSGFLVHALQWVTAGFDSAQRRDYCDQNLWGFDIDQRAVQVAKALMLVAGDGAANLYQANSLVTPSSTPGLFASSAETEAGIVPIEALVSAQRKGWRGFDAILTNPPFAGEVREPALLDSYRLARPGKRNERDVLFIERCVNLLAPGGRMAIVLPHNKIGAQQFGFVREWLLRNMRVVAVVSLGRSTFQPHTSQKAEIVLAQKRERPVGQGSLARERVLLARSERPGKDSKGRLQVRPGVRGDSPLWERSDHDLDQVVAEFRDFVASEGLAWNVE